MSSLNAGFELKRSGTGTLTIGREIGLEETPLVELAFEKGKKDLRVLFISIGSHA